MKSKILPFIAVLVTFAMNAVAQGSEPLTEARTSNPYHYIHITGDMNVKIVQEAEPGLVVEGSKFQLLNTVTILKDDTLFIYQANVRLRESKTSLTINVGNISLLEVSGNSRVDCTGLINTDFLTIRAYNGAQIKLDVRALKVDSKATGSSTIHVSGITASSRESIDGGGFIDSQSLDVIDQRNSPDECYGC